MASRGMNRVFSIMMGAIWAVGMPHAYGDLSATATISATPNNTNYDYTITVTNTGTTNIGTFWFAWTPPDAPYEYDFLPTTPISADQPAGWYGTISGGYPGTSIEYYNYYGSPISPGQIGTFSFTSGDTPADLQGTSYGFPIVTSFIYEGYPGVGSFAQIDPVFVAPEPASVGVLLLGGAALLNRRRKA